MPVTVHCPTRRLSQDEFRKVVYDVMGHIFKIHSEFGAYFDEQIYQQEIARRCSATFEVPIEISHRDFRKILFADLLAGEGAIFELKTVSAFNDRHRSQLLQYLMLADLARGKLVNLRSQSVQHEFVNTKLRHGDRTSFSIDDSDWDGSDQQSSDLRDVTIALLRDLGTNLDVGLYEEVLTHLLGGEQIVVQKVEISSGDHVVGVHPVRFAFSANAFYVTAVRDDALPRVEGHLRRFLAHTPLQAMHWINIRHQLVRFKTLRR